MCKVLRKKNKRSNSLVIAKWIKLKGNIAKIKIAQKIYQNVSMKLEIWIVILLENMKKSLIKYQNVNDVVLVRSAIQIILKKFNKFS